MLHRATRATVSRLALVTTFLTPMAAMAQTPGPAPADPATTPTSTASAQADAPAVDDAIVITGSRIAAAGYTAPTPVTVVGEEIIQRDARATIGDTIRELPAVGASSSPNNTSGAGNIVAGVTGLDTVNLRNLGVTRTLVLFDGQRVVQSNVTGQIDIGTIPTALVQRIDVVTAGASAAWGSDAVSGVVNLVLNKQFDGVRGSIEAGDTSEFDRFNYRAQLAIGKGFNDDRGRIIVAGNFFDAPSNVFANQRSWNRYTQLVNNPAYTASNNEPRLIHADNVNLSGATTGGLIVGGCRAAITATGACPAGGSASPGALLNQQFTGANGQLAAFPITNVSGQVAANAETLQASLNNLAIRYRTTSVFGLLSYDFADWLKVSVQGNYGTTFSRNNSVPFIRIGAQAPLIRVDNPYLPDAVGSQMVASGLTGINVGTTNINNATADTLSYDNFVTNSVGVPVATTDRTLKRGVISLDGDLGSGWSYNAYFQRGEVTVFQQTESNAIVGNFNKAVDAVRNSAGQIVCRVNADANAANDDPACAPLNILGTGVASQAAIRYINVAPGQNFQRQVLAQNVGAVSLQGTLPFGLPAGNIALAVGAEARSEKGTITNDPGAQARLYSVANFPSFAGRYNVKEAFAEVDVPLIKDSFIDALNFNGAIRVTDYSTSGSVTTWKLGGTADINEAIRIRGTVSRDIRAPNLNELFSTGLSTLSSAISPGTGTNVSIFTFASGNADLQPEVARTYSAGVVLRPASRFNISVDYYNINLSGAIVSVGSNEVLSRCNAGETIFCSQLVFAGPIGSNGQPLLSQINTFPENIASLKTSGIDYQADYTMPLFAGSLQMRLLGNYILQLRQEQLGNTYVLDGAIGPDNPGGTGFPKARATFSATYNQDGLSATAQTRFIGAARLVSNWTAKDVDNNRVPPIAYVDLRGSYQINDTIQVFATVDNLLNQAPPNVAASPTQGQTSYYFTPISGIIYDALGRQYRGGVRVKF
ncbi:TonB-dependent receptor domain-containing protein [Polymorphobacter fuscus]|uniref:TonB-dependent receptor n=1 Tax=Sandarakinorhabdus fusca TaxID=1439888 RepID=A0A7C9KKN3_9SPHN|nr:TonB-dependent receptor [Polymorphobacter fuscus]KAB7648218.1 TonB-dependent receptor [Polymorphobacter fuscus]MQT15724.1 TonB-dependent receptor [Polymorphobacter fuscus]NJC08005.1 outer membrane receptor protein involved in Fe transport [Polymorphobacter fuscus]